MSKITKKMMNDYIKSAEIIKKYKLEHQKVVDDIIDIMIPIVKEKHYKDSKGFSWKISNIDFRNDEEMKDQSGNSKPIKYEWVEISEEEYYKLADEEYNKRREEWRYKEKTKSKLKEQYIDTGIIYYKEEPVKYKYLRVGVNESWRYGGSDYLEYDFLLSDIMDNVYLRKEKLEILEELK